jgi:beta-glucosidase
VEVDIENTGKIAGKEVVQLYIRDLNPRIYKPMMELKDFKRFDLIPKECKNTTFHLSQNAFQFYDVRKNAWNVYSGDYQILIGSSSEDIRLPQ